MKRKKEEVEKSKKKQKLDQDSTSLIIEIEKGDPESAISLIKSGAYLDGKSKCRQTPLSSAARLGDLIQIKELINHKCDIKSSNLPIIEAIKANHFEVVKYLIEVGMEAKKRVKSTTTPLFQASKLGLFEIVKHLLELGCDPNEIDGKTGSTCLVEATKGNHFLVLELLLKYGADVNQLDKSKLSPLHHAIQRKHVEPVKLLLKTDNKLEIFIHLAVHTGNKDIVQLLIHSGFDVNGQDFKGNSTLIQAIPKKDICLLLLDNGVDVHYKTKIEHQTAMLQAAHYGILCREIFMNGGSIDDKNIYDSNLLEIAFQNSYRNIEAIEFLIYNGCIWNENFRSDENFTRIVNEFKKSDSFSFQSTEFDYKKSSISNKDLVYYSIIYNRFEIFSDLIHKIDIHQTYWGDNGLLHLSIIYVRNEMFYYLIQHFSMNFLWRNKDNLLPIEMAIKKGNQELTRKLCEIHGNIYSLDCNFFKCSRIHKEIWDQLQTWKIFKSCQPLYDLTFNFQ
jgi:ankyrin repeat protein